MGWSPAVIAGIVLLGCGHAGSALAGPVCRGKPVQSGASVHGPILHVIDERTVCVARGATPDSWSPVVLAQPAASRQVLMAAAFGKNATCAVGPDGRAACVVEGQALASAVQRPEIIRASLDWR